MLNIERSILLVALPDNTVGSGSKYINLISNRKKSIKKIFVWDIFIFMSAVFSPSMDYYRLSPNTWNML